MTQIMVKKVFVQPEYYIIQRLWKRNIDACVMKKLFAVMIALIENKEKYVTLLAE
jgi:nucleosome binding factor SPN SPT16 subunit